MENLFGIEGLNITTFIAVLGFISTIIYSVCEILNKKFKSEYYNIDKIYFKFNDKFKIYSYMCLFIGGLILFIIMFKKEIITISNDNLLDFTSLILILPFFILYILTSYILIPRAENLIIKFEKQIRTFILITLFSTIIITYKNNVCLSAFIFIYSLLVSRKIYKNKNPSFIRNFITPRDKKYLSIICFCIICIVLVGMSIYKEHDNTQSYLITIFYLFNLSFLVIDLIILYTKNDSEKSVLKVVNKIVEKIKSNRQIIIYLYKFFIMINILIFISYAIVFLELLLIKQPNEAKGFDDNKVFSIRIDENTENNKLNIKIDETSKNQIPDDQLLDDISRKYIEYNFNSSSNFNNFFKPLEEIINELYKRDRILFMNKFMNLDNNFHRCYNSSDINIYDTEKSNINFLNQSNRLLSQCDGLENENKFAVKIITLDKLQKFTINTRFFVLLKLFNGDLFAIYIFLGAIFYFVITILILYVKVLDPSMKKEYQIIKIKYDNKKSDQKNSNSPDVKKDDRKNSSSTDVKENQFAVISEYNGKFVVAQFKTIGSKIILCTNKSNIVEPSDYNIYFKKFENVEISDQEI